MLSSATPKTWVQPLGFRSYAAQNVNTAVFCYIPRTWSAAALNFDCSFNTLSCVERHVIVQAVLKNVLYVTYTADTHVLQIKQERCRGQLGPYCCMG